MRCAVALVEGEKWLWCICQETAEQCGGVAAFNRGEFVRVRPLVLRRWRDSDWSDQGLSVPKRMWSEPCVRTIWTNFSLERKLLSGVLFKTSAVSSHTFGVPISWSHTSSYIDQPPIWANTSLCGGTSFIILARRSTLASSQLGKLISIPQWIDTIRSLSFAHSIILRHLGSSILVRWNTG